MKELADTAAARIIDVNLNRLTEGLRVVEDVVRLGLEDRRLLAGIRELRIQVGRDVRALRRQALASRKSETDLGRGDRFDRAKRENLEDVLLANFKRAEESARVLEEVLKVAEPGLAGKFKAVRFRLYDLERVAVTGLADSGRARHC
jgi:thiamine-phosphate pyrophosphorylase